MSGKCCAIQTANGLSWVTRWRNSPRISDLLVTTNRANRSVSLIKNLLYAIIYLHTTELFALSKMAIPKAILDKLYDGILWTTISRKSSCKKFADLYNATPPARKRWLQEVSVESELIVECVCRLPALINFLLAPLTCYAIPISCFTERPFISGESAQAIQGDPRLS